MLSNMYVIDGQMQHSPQQLDKTAGVLELLREIQLFSMNKTYKMVLRTMTRMKRNLYPRPHRQQPQQDSAVASNPR